MKTAQLATILLTACGILLTTACQTIFQPHQPYKEKVAQSIENLYNLDLQVYALCHKAHSRYPHDKERAITYINNAIHRVKKAREMFINYKHELWIPVVVKHLEDNGLTIGKYNKSLENLTKIKVEIQNERRLDDTIEQIPFLVVFKHLIHFYEAFNPENTSVPNFAD